MSSLVVVAYPSLYQAEEVRLQLLKMQKEYLVDLEDAVIAVRKADGKVKLHQLYSLTAAGAVGRGILGAAHRAYFPESAAGCRGGRWGRSRFRRIVRCGRERRVHEECRPPAPARAFPAFHRSAASRWDKALEERAAREAR